MSSKTTNMNLVKWDSPTDTFNYVDLAENFAKIDIHDHSNGYGKQITSTGLASGSVKAAQIDKNSIDITKMQSNSVGTDQIKLGSVTGVKLADNSIVDKNINSSAAILGSKLADNSIPYSKAQTLLAGKISQPTSGTNSTFSIRAYDDEFVEGSGSGNADRYYTFADYVKKIPLSNKDYSTSDASPYSLSSMTDTTNYNLVARATGLYHITFVLGWSWDTRDFATNNQIAKSMFVIKNSDTASTRRANVLLGNTWETPNYKWRYTYSSPSNATVSSGMFPCVHTVSGVVSLASGDTLSGWGAYGMITGDDNDSVTINVSNGSLTAVMISR